jgi:predicted ATPase
MPSGKILHYQILDRLGAGGMGAVYKALDTRLHRVVALKFLPQALSADPTGRQRLLLEARAAAKLDHPNIGTVYAIEEAEDGRLFIVMVYYEGKTLEKRLIPLPLDEALHIALQTAQGLAHAHGAGVIHRDIKPANILLTRQGLVKILDFGLAQLKEPGELTPRETFAGTLAYMSPEQLREQPLDARTDIWSLGVMLYEMLSGRLPFKEGSGTSLDILGEAEPLARLRPDLPPAIASILRRSLAKDVSERYASAEELIADLAALRRARSVMTSSALPEGAGLHNLPTPKAPLVGRQEELTQVAMHLNEPDCRVLTLLGLGGIGKTRLAIEAAHEQLKGRFSGGVYFVPLEALSSSALIPATIAAALKLDLQAASPLEQLIRHIGHKHVLLVLDNYENVVEGASLAAELVQTCPNLKLLITSRVRLNIAEEWILPLQGLPVPTDTITLEEAPGFGALGLFLQQAERVLPRFALDRENLPHVIEICGLLRGLPLAIELAAVWVRLMPPQEIAREIRQNYDFLASSARNVPERQRSIRAVFEHSWNLMDAEEQDVFSRLALFRGGFTKAAAGQVAGASLPLLAGLVDKSLLEIAPRGRYEQHPLLRQYAQEKLAERPQGWLETRENHGQHYLCLLQERGKEIRGPRQKEALREIEEELENVRAAWHWAVVEAKSDLLEQAVEPLRVFYDQRGRIQEGIEALSQALAALEDASPTPSLLGCLLVHKAWLLHRIGQYQEAGKLAERGLALLRPLGESKGVILGLNTLGAIAARTGSYLQAKPRFEEALALAEAQGDQEALAICLDNLASVEQYLGNFAQARRYQEQSLTLARQLGNDSQIVMNLNSLGTLMLSMDGPREAQPLLEEGLQLAQRVGLQRMLPFFLANMGLASYKLGEYSEAQPLYQEALDMVRTSGETWLEAGLLAELGRIDAALGNYPGAQRYFARSLEIAWQNKDVPFVLRTIIYAAELQAKEGQAEQAAKLLTLVLQHPGTEQEDKDLAEGLLKDLGEQPGAKAPAGAQDLDEVVRRLCRRRSP